MIIVPLESRDILTCANIYRKLWDDRIARRAFLEMSVSLRVPECHINYYVAHSAGSIIGCAGMQASRILEGVYDFIFIGVDPDHQGRDVGRALTEHRIAEVQRRDGVAIHTITSKPGFFRKFGFRRGYVSGNLTMMHKQLKPLAL